MRKMSILRRKKNKPDKKKKDTLPSKIRLRTKTSEVSKLEVDESKFYILVNRKDDLKEITLYNEVKTPITGIKEYLKSGVAVENIELMSVTIKEGTLEVESVPWSKIAVELIT